jgi:hypothetical protein
MRELSSREINEAQGVGAFLKRWLGEAPALTLPPDEPRRGESGNINLAATIGSSPSMLLAPQDARFDEFIEPGVAPLLAATIAAGWISYTSCEGHSYPDGTADELHVGLIPRNAQERADIERIWAVVGAAWQSSSKDTPIEFGLMRSIVRCDEKVNLPTLDLYLCKKSNHEWQKYFDCREESVSFASNRISLLQT